MKLVNSIMTKNPCYTAGKKITVQGLVLHSVGCPQPRASAFIDNWNRADYNRRILPADAMEKVRYIVDPRMDDEHSLGNRKGGDRLKKKKCYIYTRVSTMAQTEGYSLDAQQVKLRKYAEYKNLEIAREYCDAGKSGKSIKGRPAFQQMMEDVASQKDDVSYVLVFKLSRFGRNAADVLKSLQLLMDYEVDLVSVDDAIDSSTQGGRLTLAILSAVAEIERENITVQFLSGMMQKLKEGGWPGGPIPYGYRKEDDKLVQHPQEAEICEEKKEFYRLLIEKIEMYPEETPDGRIVKSISFKIPVFYEDWEPTTELIADEVITYTLDTSEVGITSAEAKATYVELKKYILDRYGAKVSSLYIAQIKRKYGIDMGENYNKPDDPNKRVPKCPKAKEEMIIEALKHFKMLEPDIEMIA